MITAITIISAALFFITMPLVAWLVNQELKRVAKSDAWFDVFADRLRIKIARSLLLQVTTYHVRATAKRR